MFKENLGGGEILSLGQSNESAFPRMDTSLMGQFQSLGLVQWLIIALLIFFMIFIIMKLLGKKSPIKGRGIAAELDVMADIRKRDAAILTANKNIRNITDIIEKTPLTLSKYQVDYWNYNLIRADIRIPGGSRVYKAQEFNAIIRAIQIIVVVISIFLGIFVSTLLGFVLAVGSVFIGNTLPLMTVRAIVKAKDEEIEANFSDFYLMIHYVLIARANTPLSSIIKSYDKTTSSEEMHKFANTCISLLDTYGEFVGPTMIADRYKEIPIVCKLMRLIKQSNQGADVAPELIGFRKEIIDAKEYALRKKGDKLIAKARASFNLLMPILIQAIISAMMIYMDDLSIAGSIF